MLILVFSAALCLFLVSSSRARCENLFFSSSFTVPTSNPSFPVGYVVFFHRLYMPFERFVSSRAFFPYTPFIVFVSVFLLLPFFSDGYLFIFILFSLAAYSGRSYYGGPDYSCRKCSVVFWYHESTRNTP